MLGSAGTLIAGTLVAGALAAPAANADSDRHLRDAESIGVAVAAARAAQTGIDWQDCPADWGLDKPIQCGFVTVPVDYAKPDGKKIKIAVDRIAATGTPAERQGALLYNPGGPGASGLRFPRRVTTKNAIWANTAKAYDFVGFDPRGVGKSAPISCVDPTEFVKGPKLDPVPDSEADKLAQRKLAAEYAKGCAEKSGDMLPFMTTPNTARDLDVVRAALGEKKLNFVGVSYGTYLGAVYTQLFPGRSDRIVLDSAVDPARIWRGMIQIWAEGTEPAFTRWTEWTAERDSTYKLGRTPEAVRKTFYDLVARADRKPIELEGMKLNGDEVRSFGRATFFSVRDAASTASQIARIAVSRLCGGWPG